MDRDRELEIRRRSAEMAPLGASLTVSREDVLRDLDELLDLRRPHHLRDSTESSLRRHPSADGRARFVPEG